MIKVSSEFKQAIYASKRMTKGKVTFDISDTTINDDTITTIVSSEFEISNKEDLTDKVRENSNNIATFEPNRFKLDGSFSFADELLENNKYVGWVSNNLCNNLGPFTSEEVLSFGFNNIHSSMGITVTFDTLNNEYATDFTISAYDGANSLIHSVDVIDNTHSQAVTLGQFYLYKKIEVIIKKWSKPYRRARVVEVDFGVVRVYTDDNLIKMDLIEEMDMTTNTIPSSELKFTVYNKNREFNILNPEGFYKFLQERQQILPEIGVVLENGAIEYVKLGEFYLMSWISDEGSLTTTFTSRNIIDIIATYEYENLVTKVSYSLYDLAVEIMTICGVIDHEIDPELKNISTYGLIKKTNCRTILQMIAIAGCSNIYVTKANKLVIKVTPITLGASIDTIAMDDMYNEPKIELEPIVKSVEVFYYIDLENKQEVLVNKANVTEGNTLKVDNTLINSEVQAISIANWILKQKSYRAKYTANWRGNPAHELNDVVIIEDSYNQNNKTIITKNELTYQGYLTGKTEARGLIE